ncbi:hypothetical protein ACU8KH_02483 [Lachancea thermotolerans]
MPAEITVSQHTDAQKRHNVLLVMIPTLVVLQQLNYSPNLLLLKISNSFYSIEMPNGWIQLIQRGQEWLANRINHCITFLRRPFELFRYMVIFIASQMVFKSITLSSTSKIAVQKPQAAPASQKIVIGSLVCDSAKLHNDTLSRSDHSGLEKYAPGIHITCARDVALYYVAVVLDPTAEVDAIYKTTVFGFQSSLILHFNKELSTGDKQEEPKIIQKILAQIVGHI